MEERNVKDLSLTEISKDLNAILKCIDDVKTTRYAELVKDKRDVETINAYFANRTNIKKYLELLKVNYDVMLKGEESTVRDLQKPADTQYDKKIQSMHTVIPNFTKLSADLEKFLEERKRDKEKLQRDTRHILIEEFLEPIRKSTKTKAFKEQDVLDALVKRCADLTDRLAAEMNAKLAKDESDLENISIQNRPMNVAEEYSLMMSNAWLDAKTAMDELSANEAHEQKKYEALCEILLEAEQRAHQAYNTAMENIGRAMKHPVLHNTEQTRAMVAAKTTKDLLTRASKTAKLAPVPDERAISTDALPDNVQCAVGDYLRICADFTNLDCLYQDVKKTYIDKNEQGKKTMDAIFGKDHVIAYTNQCVRLAWKMVIQRPPMAFGSPDCLGTKWKDNKDLDLLFGSDLKNPKAVIKYYKHPVMMHHDKVMVKGAVYVGV